MRLDDLKHQVIDWFKERRYASGKAPLIAVSIVLGLALIWIGSFFIGGESYPVPTKVNETPELRELWRVGAEIREDQRFRHLDAMFPPDEPNVIRITGEVYTNADKAALEAKVHQMTSEYRIEVGDIHVMQGH